MIAGEFVFSNFCKQVAALRVVTYADGIARETMHFVAGALGDQQVLPSIAQFT